jgi:uracil-DNA glycosylase
VRVPTDELSERYLKKAIAEMNELGHEIAQAAGTDRAPVLGSGHPLGDVFLLKHTPRESEIHEGVAFFGRAGQAVLKSIQRLGVEPTAIYGTNCLKYEGEDEEEAHGWLARELHVVQPKIVVAMGEDALACLNAISFPLSTPVDPTTGTIASFTPTIDALVTPDVDASLDEQPAKRAFWEAFKALGPWWSELPPY